MALLRTALFAVPWVLLPACFSPTEGELADSEGSSSGSTTTTDSGSTTDSATATTTTDSTTATTTTDSTTTTSATTATATGGSECGDGQLDDGEQCDDGDANSDETPDACRTNCMNADCGDGVIDAGEVCDDGAGNSDDTADACRTTCVLPSCGDGTVDDGEACDDANEAWGDTCYQCIERFYYVLNSPSSNSSGDDSITRVTKEEGSVVLVAPNVVYNGSREIEVEPDGSALYVMQSNFGLVQQRIIIFDAETGVEVDEIDVDEAALGYPSSPVAMTRGINGILYVVVLESGQDTHFVAVDPSDGSVTEEFAFGFTTFIGDMTTDDGGFYYITTGSNDTVLRASPAMNAVSTWADANDGLDNPFGITYDPATDTIWVGNSRPSIEAQIVRFNASGVAQAPVTITGFNQPQLRGLFVDDDGMALAPLGMQDTVAQVDPTGTPTPLFQDLIDYPTDIKVIDFGQ